MGWITGITGITSLVDKIVELSLYILARLDRQKVKESIQRAQRRLEAFDETYSDDPIVATDRFWNDRLLTDDEQKE